MVDGHLVVGIIVGIPARSDYSDDYTMMMLLKKKTFTHYHSSLSLTLSLSYVYIHLDHTLSFYSYSELTMDINNGGRIVEVLFIFILE